MKPRFSTLCKTLALTIGSLLFSMPAGAQTTFGGNAQHTANYSAAAQNLNAVHWTTSIDFNNTGGLAHYGAPLITPANTIFVPAKTGATGGFQINVFNAANGSALYSLSTDYTQPSHNWILPYQPVLATSALGTRLYYPGAGGTVYSINNVDSASHGAPVQQVFYTTLANYQANASSFNSTVFINTPITADSNGNVFFGFRVDGAAPAPLSTTQSGFARIDPNGNAIYVLAGTAAGDANIGRDTHNSGPAVSNDQATVYVAVKSATTESYGYLLGLDSTTLATKFKVFLKDPRGNNANNATLLDDSTASPLVGPDNDVYFGIFGNPGNGSRGFMLHFSGDLTVQKTPGGFGWDNTPGIVPASMVPSYTGPSSYLLFSKYNNYANAGNDSGDGVNRIALLDPNATQVDAHASSNGMPIMREVLSVIGPTADQESRSASLPGAVREWCINTPAVNPATNSVFVPSEDGHVYRWNLVSNSLTQFLQLNAGIGEPYVPTIVGPDGTVFTLNGGTMSALGSLRGVGVTLTSSVPDVRSVVAGQSLTFTVAVTNTGTPGFTPTGSVTIQDTVYFVPSPGVQNSTTTTLASNIVLDGSGHAAFTTSGLTADKHFITASYSGDGRFSAGNSALVQFVHASGSTTTLASSPDPSNSGQPVTFTATVAAAPPGSGTPTGMVTFQDGNTVLAQVPLNGSGVSSFTTSGLTLGNHTVTAVYASDTNFAASSGSTAQAVQNLNATTTTVSSSPNPSVFGQPVTFTSTITSGGGVPVGTVTFTDGATVLASNVNVDGGGHASFNTAALSVGSHVIVATFNGSAGWPNSSGSTAPQIVNKASSSTTVGSSSNPSALSQAVTFTATVSVTAPGSGVPAGSVTFKNGSATLGAGTLDGGGRATLTTSALPAGSNSITGVYNGSVNFNASSSQALSQMVNAPAPSVSITSPAAGTASGTVTFSASATAASGLQITNLQLKVDGSNFGSPNTVASSPSTVTATLNTATLTNGPHTLTAMATDSANGAATSAPVVINVSNGTPPPPTTAFITGQSPGGSYNSFTGLLGMQFTTGSSPLMVTSLGRFCVSGNAGTHLMKLVQANGLDLNGGSTTVSMLGCTAAQYQYANLGGPVTLPANTTYYLVSQETYGGDQWDNAGPVTVASGAGSVNGPAYYYGSYLTQANPGYAYGPVNLRYGGSSATVPPSVSITSPPAGPVSGTITLTAQVTPGSNPVANVRFQLDGSNFGPAIASAPYSTTLDTKTLVNGSTHQLTAVATDTLNNSGTSSQIAITVNNSGSPSGSPLITAQSPGGPANYFSGWLGMEFTTGSSALTVSSLGRFCISGNSGTHAVKLVTSVGTDIPGGSVSVAMGGCSPGTYKYQTLPAPLVLAANTMYFLVSQEVNGGDQWSDAGPVTSTSAATVNVPVYFYGYAYYQYGSAGSAYVPVNLLYK